jgi:hypothetical protein
MTTRQDPLRQVRAPALPASVARGKRSVNMALQSMARLAPTNQTAGGRLAMVAGSIRERRRTVPARLADGCAEPGGITVNSESPFCGSRSRGAYPGLIQRIAQGRCIGQRRTWNGDGLYTRAANLMHVRHLRQRAGFHDSRVRASRAARIPPLHCCLNDMRLVLQATRVSVDLPRNAVFGEPWVAVLRAGPPAALRQSRGRQCRVCR